MATKQAGRDVLAVWLGDSHCGAVHGLTTPRAAVSERQAWLAATFTDLVKRVKTEARGKALHVHLGGDLVHMPGDDDHRELAELLFRPLVEAADAAYAVAGTEYHVGRDGADDRTIYRGLGIPRRHIGTGTAFLDVAGRAVIWAHHGPRVGKRPHTELDGLDRVAEDTYRRAMEWREPAPALVIGHHVHTAPGAIHRRGIWVATCPALCLSDGYAAKVAFLSRPSIGALVYHPRQNAVEIWSYDVPRNHLYA